jgi:hypothetical protein
VQPLYDLKSLENGKNEEDERSRLRIGDDVDEHGKEETSEVSQKSKKKVPTSA